MSKWTDVRDAVEKEIQISGVAEEVRRSVLSMLANEAIPAAEAFLGKFVEGVKAESEHESGWCKIRDAVVIPYGIQALTWLGKYVINRTIVETAKQ